MTAQDVSPKVCYVYALFREDGITPFYIGKGRGNRMHVHERNAHKETTHKDRIIRNMLANGISPIPKAILVDGLTSTEASRIEIDLIRLIGRWPNGPLANLTQGGDGGDVSPETKEKRTKANIKTWSDPSIRQKRVDGMRAVWTDEKRIEHSKRLATRDTPEYREKLSNGVRTAYARPETKKRHADSAKRSAPKKISALKKRWSDPDTYARWCAAISEAQNRPEAREKRSRAAIERWRAKNGGPSIREQRELESLRTPIGMRMSEKNAPQPSA